ncbi:MAG: SUMF1/EgtB/PvdO family nonheme iron enzyme [Verrucomicrobia bacterium]|nr:SUMF1/EgtB/PvdO family nonheme iron enzyme [Verrucomicrobiota bacterium]
MQRSTDLEHWSTVSGYPQTAAGLAIGHTFVQAANEFFRIEPIDEQVPVIVDQFPGEDAYAVRRFEDLHFLLGDASGIDPASIRLTLGNGAALSIGAPGLTFVDNVLTYDSGDAALGAYGATVPVTLTMADTLGHSVTHTFSFTLEVLPKVVPNLYVFGSPAAQRAGQQIPATPTAALAKPTGPVPMDAPDPWSIESVLTDRVIIAYTGATAPVFAAGAYLANLTPVKLTDIFYRKILSVSDAPAIKQLTLMTTDVPLAEIVEEGTATPSADSVVYDLDDAGTIQPAAQISFNMVFPRMGINKDGAGPLNLPGNPKFGVSLPEANIWYTPSLEIALETKGFAVQRASIQSRGDIEAALVPELTYRPAGTEKEKEWELHAPVTKLVFVGAIGIVPVWLDFTYSTKIKFEAEANAALTLRAGLRGHISVSAGASYSKDASPRVAWTQGPNAVTLDVVPLTVAGGGTANAKLSVVPQIDVRLESLLGFYVNVSRRVEAELTATGSFSFTPSNGRVQIGSDLEVQGTLGTFIDLNAGLSIIGVDQSYLPAFDPFRLFSRGWEWSYPPPEALTFTLPTGPQAVSVALGGTLSLQGQAQGGEGAIFYQWLHNGILLPGQTSGQITIPNVTSGNAGTYTLRARAGTETVTSPAFTVTTYNAGTPLSGFSYIPAGSFEMGQTGIATPVHSVYVSGFYMGRTEVTWLDWRTVRDWAVTHGYTDLSGRGAGKADNHPVHSISWYQMVRWCNAKSEMAGLTPCYMLAGAVYRTTDNSAVVCNWSANGYRLPTEAEWEKAARGGLSAQNFPWGNTITHSRANYNSSSSYPYYAYDVSPTRGCHPTYATGAEPYTSPVGSFAPNGFGLYDMAGNVWEWPWDWLYSYTAGSQTDPRGPASGAGESKGIRGAGWENSAPYCRVASRYSAYPSSLSIHIGFRVARSSVP